MSEFGDAPMFRRENVSSAEFRSFFFAELVNQIMVTS